MNPNTIVDQRLSFLADTNLWKSNHEFIFFAGGECVYLFVHSWDICGTIVPQVDDVALLTCSLSFLFS
jgi:hypothetical protein